jgi:limonene-1,2-epoxide hydrolase
MQVIDAWKGGHIDAVVAHLTDDFVWHYAAAIAPPVIGKAAAHRAMSRISAEQTPVAWRILSHAETADRLFVEGIDEHIGKDGKRVIIPYAGVLDFRGDLICGWRDYFDVGVVEAQKQGKAMAEWMKALLERPAS